MGYSRLCRFLLGLLSAALMGCLSASGLDARVVSAAPAQTPLWPAVDPARLSFQLAATGLSSPVYVTNAADGSGRLFILEKLGRIRILKNGSLLATPFLDISSKVKSTYSEQGLLGLAFDPAHASNGYFYVAYTAPRAGDTSGSVLTLERYSVSAIADVANPDSGITTHPGYDTDKGANNGGSQHQPPFMKCVYGPF